MILSNVLDSLTQNKAKDIQTVDVSDHIPWMDIFIICTATSGRHAKSIAGALIQAAKVEENPPLGVEGLNENEWILVNLNDIIVHIMSAEKRAFYQLDQLWH